MSTVTGWARVLGVSLRPWSGRSPGSLVLRAIVQLAIFAVLAFFAVRALAKDNQLGQFMAGPEFAEVKGLTFVVVAVVVALLLTLAAAVLRLIVGFVDFVPRRQIDGVVLSLSERRLGDFLPSFAQTMIWSHNLGRGNQTTIDQRKYRTELVLQTAEGVKSWTIHNQRFRNDLQVGSSVRLSVSPLLGYVANVAPASDRQRSSAVPAGSPDAAG